MNPYPDVSSTPLIAKRPVGIHNNDTYDPGSGTTTPTISIRRKPVPGLAPTPQSRSSSSDSHLPHPHSHPHPQPPLLRPQATRTGVLLAWRWEILAFVVSLVLLAAIFVTLHKFNGREYPDWKLNGINVNSLVAVYTTILRALLLVPVAEVIGQGQWPWFDNPRPLKDVEVYSRAARGAWGSARLLSMSWKPSLASVGAVVTIVSLAIGPFAQQAVKQELCAIAVGETGAKVASVPVANYVPGDGAESYWDRGDIWVLSTESLSSIITSLVQPNATADTSILQTTCTMGNCTFNDDGSGRALVPYTSLGMCSSCTDMTDQIVLNKTDRGNVYMLNTTSTISTTKTLNVSHAVYSNALSIDSARSWQDYEVSGDFSVSELTILSLTKDGVDMSADRLIFNQVAASCHVYPCLKSYNGTFENGVLNEKVLSAERPMYGEFTSWNYTALAIPCYVGFVPYDLSNMSSLEGDANLTFVTLNISNTYVQAPSQCVYQMAYGWPQAISATMNTWLTGTCSMAPSTSPSAPSARCVVSAAELFWLSALWKNGTATFETLSQSIEDIAVGLTNRMRNIGRLIEPGDVTTNTRIQGSSTEAAVLGTTYRTAVCVRFDAYWLLLPSTLALLTCVILCLTIWQGLREREARPPWKSSPLPLLFHGIAGDRGNGPMEQKLGQDEGVRPLTLQDMQNQAKGTRVTFARGVASGDSVVGFVRDEASGSRVRAEDTTYTAEMQIAEVLPKAVKGRRQRNIGWKPWSKNGGYGEVRSTPT